jgi:hypothetical protein
MIVKVGNIVSHVGGAEWGSGKVLEVTPTLAMIQFSDGKHRKIASSHFSCLQPAAGDSYISPSEPAPAAKEARIPVARRKKKQ